MVDYHLYSLVDSHLRSYHICIVELTTNFNSDGMGITNTGNHHAYSATITQTTTLAIAF